MAKEKKISPYQIMTSVLKPPINPLSKDEDRFPSKEQKESINSFFMCRYLSNHPSCIFVANVFNMYDKIPVNVQYDVSRQIFGGKIKWIQYPKQENNEDKLLENVCKFYKISEQNGMEYINLMSDDDKERLLRIYDGA